MSNDQPQHHNPYEPQDPYAAHPPQGAYGRQPSYGQQGQQPYDPYAQQQPQQPQEPAWPAAGGQGGRYDQYGYDAYGQQQPPERPDTQTWNTTTWDTGIQPLPAQAPDTAAPGGVPPQHQSAPPAEEPYTRQQPQPPRHAAPAPAAAAGHRSAAARAAAAEPAPRPITTAPLAPNQRARAEGRSPIIPPGLKPAALTAGLALLLAVAAPLGRPALAVPVVLLQAVTAAGWFRLNGMWPARQGIALAFLAGVTTDAALLATHRENAPVVAIGTLGVWCLFVLVLQLRNRSSADERMYALTAGLASTALVVLASGQLAAVPQAVTVGAAAVGVATLARALPLPSVASVAVALLAAAGAGIAAGRLTGFGDSGALLGLAAGGCALIGLRVASYDYPSRFVHMTAGVALPLTLAAPAVYVLGRALG
ncbi:hypothetical protein FCH28_16565 [Streptomyces piniterrae]|uniref:Peptidase C83 domain-containing protein n=1 Tax=Streptomyces piniterrae TaxID=2571125 RepID=A0A4U0NFB1_9ACTN|nr:hypothetical protein [Streptomyces piniterrae]TJZ52801.1 hypothetical protein FCH28_16565 [Streptomyces piniterrae]